MTNFYKNIFNIPYTICFWDTIAKTYLHEFSLQKIKLADVLFLVPNRRACLALTNSFVKEQGLTPTILPQIVPITDIEDDELFFSSFDMDQIWENISQPISKEERLFLFARMIMSKPNEFGITKLSPAQAVNLAMSLANLMDTAYNQNLSFDKLYDLVPEKYATHWQEILKLLKIITEYWPQILDERKAKDVVDLKNIILTKQAALWEEQNTKKHIIAAGITASFPSIVKTLSVISKLEHGKIYFSGIDNIADDDYWNSIDENHSQFEIKDLLKKLNLDRRLITNLQSPLDKNRELFISELMRPASVSDKWLSIKDRVNSENVLNNFQIINAKTQRDEALAIALKMREVLSIPEKTAVLVTSDRNLSRRVVSELKRFNIDIDDSAGIPFALTNIGIFLRLIAESAQDLHNQIKLIDLLKNPLTYVGFNSVNFRNNVYDLELNLRKNNGKKSDCSFEILNKLKTILQEFNIMLNSDKILFSDAVKLHIEIAEQIASTDETLGASLLWRKQAGKVGVNFISKILQTGNLLGMISGHDYIALFTSLMNFETVRTNYGTHPRLSILGPIEAYLQNFDYIIIGELNEGIWPKLPKADMWMSRPMMIDFGFATPEKNIGIMANCFCSFMMLPNVILTRADRIDGTPMQKSRWLLRLETITKALGKNIDNIVNDDFHILANTIDKPHYFKQIKAPSPCPPVNARPRKLSASGINLLVEDPYSVFAKYILKLYPLDELDRPLDQRDYGTLIHAIIEDFNNLYPNALPENALNFLIELGYKYFDTQNINDDIKAFWLPKFLATAKWVIEQEKDYRFNVEKIYNEVNGESTYELPQGYFTLTAKADRIDVLKDGCINILDYKTGKIPSKKQVENGHALQLLIEALLARKNAYSIVKNKNVSNLIYWQLGKDNLEISHDIDELINKTEEYILKLINTFDFETTPYHSRPTPKFISKNRDYEHLARIKEWSVQEDGDYSNDE